jgi:hypothetical protein
MSRRPLNPLVTKDPVSGAELIVTRLESPESGVVIEGEFSLGWVGRLTPEQLDFVGLLLKHRNNLQRLANELGVAYNTARSRLDDVVAALGGEPDQDDAGDGDEPDDRTGEILEKLASGEIDFADALGQLKRG